MHWNTEEIKVLIENFERLNNDELSNLLPGRTVLSIKDKLARLGLSRGKWSLPMGSMGQARETTITENAYFAGHFDGEGCVRLALNGKSYKIRISITLAHKPTLEKYQECFGGSLCSAGGVKKALWKWHLSGYHRSLIFIDTIIPFSMEKREQLEVARNYIVKRIEASMTQPSGDIRELARLSAHRLTQLKKM
jgi:hypothetical protein